VREDDVARARNALKASLLFAQDSTHREWLARSWGLEGCCRAAAGALAGRSRAAACAASVAGRAAARQRPHLPPPRAAPLAEVAESIGRDLLVYGRRLPKAELFARIDAVDADTVSAAAQPLPLPLPLPCLPPAGPRSASVWCLEPGRALRAPCACAAATLEAEACPAAHCAGARRGGPLHLRPGGRHGGGGGHPVPAGL
jgi:hypothetical protein